MSTSPNAGRLIALPAAAESGSPPAPASAAAAESFACAFCFGTGMEVVAGRGARRCRCRVEGARKNLFEAARIPPRYRGCSLSNYRPAAGDGSQLRAFALAYRLARDYPSVERGLLFTGPVGVGKTHLSVAVLRELMEKKGAACLFCEAGSLLKEIQESYNPASRASEQAVLAPVIEAEVLVLDELGGARPTEWARETMTQVIGARYDDRKLTILTSNYGDERGRPCEETLEERVGGRLRSRLYEMCETVAIEGEDYRRSFDKQ